MEQEHRRQLLRLHFKLQTEGEAAADGEAAGGDLTTGQRDGRRKLSIFREERVQGVRRLKWRDWDQLAFMTDCEELRKIEEAAELEEFVLSR